MAAQAPIDLDVLEQLELTGWQEAKKAIVKAVQSDRPLQVDGSETVANRILERRTVKLLEK